MDLSINGESIEVKPEVLTFQQLIHWIETDLLKDSGQVLTQIRVNGTEIDESIEQEIRDAKISDIESVEILSETPQNLVLQGLKDADEMIPQIINDLDVCVTKVQDQNHQEAVQSFIKVTDGLSWFSTIYSGAASIYQDKIVALQLDSHEFIQASTKLNEVLNEILEAYNNQDHTNFADLLEYELKAILQSLHVCTPDFRERLSRVQ